MVKIARLKTTIADKKKIIERMTEASNHVCDEIEKLEFQVRNEKDKRRTETAKRRNFEAQAKERRFGA